MKSKAVSLSVIFVIYAIAIAAGAVLLISIKDIVVNPVLAVFIADVAATVIVYFSSIIFNNASTYDPYWSISPPLIVLAYYLYGKVELFPHHLLVLVPLLIWSIRLTYNWIRGFENLLWQDWRYTKLKKDNPKLYQIICFFGIMLMPTILVYVGTAPLWAVINTSSLSAWHLTGALIVLAAVTVQAVADGQMLKFRNIPRTKKECMDSGLWRYSRHPNYLGEIMVWWGIVVAALSNADLIRIPFLGAAAITLLFIFISIPMMEKHILSSRPEYTDYKKTVPSPLLPWFRRK